MEIPLLDMSLNEIETSLPVIVSDYYDLQIKESEIVEPDDASKAPAWKLQLVTTGPTNTIPNPQTGKSEHLEIGHPIFNHQQLAPTGKATAKMIGQNVGAIVQAIKPTMPSVQLHTIRDWHKTTIGKMVRVKVIIQPAGSKDGKSWKTSNKIDEWVKA